MHELSTFEKARILVKAACGEEWGDGYTVMDIASDYAEPSYRLTSEDGAVVLGNWNPKRFPSRNEDGEVIDPLTKEENMPERLASALEKIGADIEWFDEWVRCGECCKVFRSQPDSYSWTMHGAWWECDYYCVDCIREHLEDFITDEDFINNAQKCLMPDLKDALIGLDYVQWEESNPHYFESDWHPGQDDNPADVLASIKEHNKNLDVVFVLLGSGQFDIRWAAFTKLSED